jgi:phosphate starvation-inducible protein PhoH
MNEKDIVRHKLVTRIVNAYNKYEAEIERGKEYTENKKTTEKI